MFYLAKPTILFYASRGMFAQEPIEWPDKIEVVIDQLESEAGERELSREERAVLDIYETVPILQSEDCLHEFWQSGIDHQRTINSYELIGATSLVDPMNASRWCGARSEDRNDYTETETEYLAEIEEDVPGAIEELVELLLDFVDEELS
jgi:hypothetical protein